MVTNQFQLDGLKQPIFPDFERFIERRLKREGYVEDIEMNNKGLYSITPKGQKLLEGWIAFLSAYSK